MKMNDRNVRILVENANGSSGFHIYLDIAGSREYLMSHRHNAALYSLLKGGPTLQALERNTKKKKASVVSCGRTKTKSISPYLRRRKNYSRKIENSVNHIILTVEDYMADRRQTSAGLTA